MGQCHQLALKMAEETVDEFVRSDLLTNLERTPDHCSNLAVNAHAHNMNAHRFLRSLKEGNSAFLTQI